MSFLYGLVALFFAGALLTILRLANVRDVIALPTLLSVMALSILYAIHISVGLPNYWFPLFTDDYHPFRIAGIMFGGFFVVLIGATITELIAAAFGYERP